MNGSKFLWRMAADAGHTLPARVLWFGAATYLFLWVPDLDLLLLDLLHHRSIVTHSVLPALGLLVLNRRARAPLIAGALLGLGVHLSCDLLSPMVGFGQVWLPEPVQVPLGSLSYLWLGGNAVIAFILARQIAQRAFPARLGMATVLSGGSFAAVGYGWLNEEDLSAVLVTMLLFGMSLAAPFLRGTRLWRQG